MCRGDSACFSCRCKRRLREWCVFFCFLRENRISSCYRGKGSCERVRTDRLHTHCLIWKHCGVYKAYFTPCLQLFLSWLVGYTKSRNVQKCMQNLFLEMFEWSSQLKCFLKRLGLIYQTEYEQIHSLIILHKIFLLLMTVCLEMVIQNG